MSGRFVAGDRTLGLAIATWRDEVATGQLNGRGDPIRGRAAEQQAAAFWLEHRGGPAGRSLSDLAPRIGRSLSGIDIAGTVEAITRCLEVVPSSWRAVTVVSAGWRVGVHQLQLAAPADGGPPWLERAGLPGELPQGLSRHSLNARVRAFREELIRRGLAEGTKGSVSPEEREEPRVMRAAKSEPIIGWKRIAEALGGVSVDTARRRVAQGLPVYQSGQGATVWAFREELAAWLSQGQFVLEVE